MTRTFLFVALPGLLCVGMTLAQNPTTPSRTPAAQDYSFAIPAGDVWTDTHIDLYPGDRVHVTGAVINCAGPTPTEKLHLPLASAPGGALLAKLHAEAEPVLASPDAEFPIIDRSHLYLGVNGWRCPGKIPAKVHVEHRATEARKP
jgi:hypothetical protein